MSGVVVRLQDAPSLRTGTRPRKASAVAGGGLSHAIAGQRIVTAAELGRALGGRSARQIYDDRHAGMPFLRLNRGRGAYRYPLTACLRWHGHQAPAEPSTGGDDPTRRSA